MKKMTLILLGCFYLFQCQNSSQLAQNSTFDSDSIQIYKFDIDSFNALAEEKKKHTMVKYEGGGLPTVMFFRNDSLFIQNKYFSKDENEPFYFECKIIPKPPFQEKILLQYNFQGKPIYYQQTSISGDLLLSKATINPTTGKFKIENNNANKYQNLVINLDSLFQILESKKLINSDLDTTEEHWIELYKKQKKLSEEEYENEFAKYEADRTNINIELSESKDEAIWIVTKTYLPSDYYTQETYSEFIINANTGEIIKEKLAYKDQ